MQPLTRDSAEPPAPSACLNCDQRFDDPRPRYCPACGQETNVKPPRIGEFIQQFGGAYFSTEGALWRTLALLLLKPGELTRQYLAGRRRHYVLPLRLYITISLVALLLVRLVAATDLVVEMPEGAAAKAPIRLSSKLGVGEVGIKDGNFYCTDLPVWFCQRVKKRIDVDAKALVAETERFRDRFLGNLGGAMFLLLPTFALWLKLAYFNRRMRYTEHLVFALHVHAFWFVVVGLLATGPDVIALAAVVAVPVYAALAARRVYGGRWSITLLRGAAVMSAYGMTLALSLAIVGLWTLLF
jgi:Protein of unknown function (DUF3667)